MSAGVVLTLVSTHPGANVSAKPKRLLRSLNAFLSHRYKSPEINLRFFDLFSKAAQVQFSVDAGDLATNVTRLERLVRSSDAFIGIYPLSAEPSEVPSVEDMRKDSRYFRLELDLAIRARIPTIVFTDARYGNILSCPSWVRQYTFQASQVLGKASTANDILYAKSFKSFADAALEFQSFRITDAVSRRQSNKVVLLLSPQLYPAELRARIKAVMEDCGRETVEVAWPPVLSKEFYAAMGETDWVVVDVGDDAASSGIVGFLHGFFVPAIRLQSVTATRTDPGDLRQSLVGAYEVGFPKDIVLWSDASELESALRARVATILLPQRLVDTPDAAKLYFESAALRKEVVFVSYSGKDADVAKEIIAALKKSFKTVFDYKDGTSIVPGKPWLAEIFQSLTQSAVAVLLLSDSYVQSGNCLHEAREIVALRDAGNLKFVPVKLYQENVSFPPWLGDTQYARLADMASPSEITSIVSRALADQHS